MNTDEQDYRGIPMICWVLAVVALALAGGLWLRHVFANTDAEARTAVQPGNWQNAATPPATTAVPSQETGDPVMESQLGSTMAQQNRTQDAIGHYREAVRLYHEQLRQTPDSPERLNNLAWLLAANPFAEIRNGQEAVERAKRACELTDWRAAMMVGTLGAAYAEAGQFDEAVTMAQKARVVALANGQPEVASKNEELMKVYQAGKAYREAY